MIPPTQREPILQVQNLSVTLPLSMDRTHALQDVSFDLYPQEILCVVGESGSGKSITASAIMGILPPKLEVASGDIKFRGESLLANAARLRELRGKVLAMVFQDPLSALNPLMTVGDQIVEVMEVHRVGTNASRKEKMLSLLAEVGLPEPVVMQSQYPFRLSGGQRQRVMIAMALALDPEVLIADEPTTALDVTTQRQILDLIMSVQRRKGHGGHFHHPRFRCCRRYRRSGDRYGKGQGGRSRKDAGCVVGTPTSLFQALDQCCAGLKADESNREDLSERPIVVAVEGLHKSYTVGRSLFSPAAR